MVLAIGWATAAAFVTLCFPRVRTEIADVVEYRWSRWRVQRRLPRARLRRGTAP